MPQLPESTVFNHSQEEEGTGPVGSELWPLLISDTEPVRMSHSTCQQTRSDQRETHCLHSPSACFKQFSLAIRTGSLVTLASAQSAQWLLPVINNDCKTTLVKTRWLGFPRQDFPEPWRKEAWVLSVIASRVSASRMTGLLSAEVTTIFKLLPAACSEWSSPSPQPTDSQQVTRAGPPQAGQAVSQARNFLALSAKFRNLRQSCKFPSGLYQWILETQCEWPCFFQWIFHLLKQCPQRLYV